MKRFKTTGLLGLIVALVVALVGLVPPSSLKPLIVLGSGLAALLVGRLAMGHLVLFSSVAVGLGRLGKGGLRCAVTVGGGWRKVGRLLVVSLPACGVWWGARNQLKFHEPTQYANAYTSLESIDWEGESSLPDIYLIIPDGYPGQNTLQKYFEYSNSDFVEALESRGFYVVPGSYSNYPRTGFH